MFFVQTQGSVFLSTSDNQTSNFGALMTRISRESFLIISIAASIFILLALIGYDSRDSGWSHLGYQPQIHNMTGATGAWAADLIISGFGFGAFIIPFVLSYLPLRCMLRKTNSFLDNIPFFILRTSGCILLVISFCALCSTHISNKNIDYPFSVGGILGAAVSDWSVSWLSIIGSSVILFTIFLFSLTLIIEAGWLHILEKIGSLLLYLNKYLPDSANRPESEDDRSTPKEAIEDDLFSGITPKTDNTFREANFASSQPKAKSKKKSARDKAPKTLPEQDNNNHHVKIVPLSETHKPIQDIDSDSDGTAIINKRKRRTIPSLELLDPAELSTDTGYSSEQLEQMSRLLEHKLKDFGVIAEVVEVNPGPVITRFEIQPAPGVKASKITNLAKDLARSMAVSSVRVVEVISGKSVVGIEIPNATRLTVHLSEVLNSKPYSSASSHITLGLGNDIAGNPVVANLAKMPHLLVAGTTGSGKSVGVNAMLLSLLFKATPDEVRLILVDPKMLELSIYEGIPHLLTPVITDMKDAASGLRWCVGEMERRYRLMAKMGVRNLAGFNDKVIQAQKQGNILLDPLWNELEKGEPAPELDTLPYIVVVIDEFADMMMLVGKKVEELIARIAQKARAAGIHLILATQRPSVDVITGLIKANIPTRIAFQVSSRIDSRTILDQSGAEHLLGWGDMLYLPAGTSLPNRVHGAFVSDDEVHRVVEAWKKIGQPDYINEILNGESAIDSTGSASLFDDEQDPLYDEAVAFVLETRKASISSVQRKLKIGYNRAARMIEAMEAAGLVSPAGTNGQREIIVPQNHL